jgi:hypothetical protein
MRRPILLMLLGFPALACAAVPWPEGRWEGSVLVPEKELRLVVDLAQDSAGGWVGSLIVPGLGIKGAPLAKIVVTGADLSFDAGRALESPTYGPAVFNAHLVSADAMSGDMRQGGNSAKFSLARVARAQVESPARSTPVGRELEGAWTGEFELGGYPRHVTITFENHADAAATAKFVIVGKQTTNVPVDLVIEEGSLLRIESQANGVVFEGRFARDSGQINGIVELGPLELPLALRRAPARAS